MASTISVGNWMESLRAMARGISGECYRARALLALCSSVLLAAEKLVANAEAREGGAIAAKSVRDDVTQALSRFESYASTLDDVGTKTDIDSRIRCEGVSQYLLDGITGDASQPPLAQPDASAAAALWNRALVLTRTLDPSTPDPDVSEVLSQAAEDAAAAVSDAGASARDTITEWKDKIADIGADIAEKAENIAMLLALGLGIGLALWLLIGRK